MFWAASYCCPVRESTVSVFRAAFRLALCVSCAFSGALAVSFNLVNISILLSAGLALNVRSYVLKQKRTADEAPAPVPSACFIGLRKHFFFFLCVCSRCFHSSGFSSVAHLPGSLWCELGATAVLLFTRTSSDCRSFDSVYSNGSPVVVDPDLRTFRPAVAAFDSTAPQQLSDLGVPTYTFMLHDILC